jgi:hypothetical protein
MRLHEARTQGWSHLRICGIPRPVGSEREWMACLQYEQQIHRMVTDMDLLALCAYRLGGIHDWALNGLRQSHHAALSRDNDAWRFGPTTLIEPH